MHTSPNQLDWLGKQSRVWLKWTKHTKQCECTISPSYGPLLMQCKGPTLPLDWCTPDRNWSLYNLQLHLVRNESASASLGSVWSWALSNFLFLNTLDFWEMISNNNGLGIFWQQKCTSKTWMIDCSGLAALWPKKHKIINAFLGFFLK